VAGRYNQAKLELIISFQICIDVQHFSPKELSIRTVDNILWVEGKHEEKQDEHG
jgi:crystallin alpha B